MGTVSQSLISMKCLVSSVALILLTSGSVSSSPALSRQDEAASSLLSSLPSFPPFPFQPPSFGPFGGSGGFGQLPPPPPFIQSLFNKDDADSTQPPQLPPWLAGLENIQAFIKDDTDDAPSASSRTDVATTDESNALDQYLKLCYSSYNSGYRYPYSGYSSYPYSSYSSYPYTSYSSYNYPTSSYNYPTNTYYNPYGSYNPYYNPYAAGTTGTITGTTSNGGIVVTPIRTDS